MREVLFGSRELTEYYRKSMALIHQYKLYQPYKLDVNDTEATLILFNCFRYRRHLATGRFLVEYLDLGSGKWQKDRVIHGGDFFYFSRCPDIRCFHSKKWLLNAAKEQMLNQVSKVVERKNYVYFDRNAPKKGRLYLDQVDSIIKKYISRNNVIMQNAFNHEKRIGKWLWQYFFDRTLISAVTRIELWENTRLSTCVSYQKHLNKIDKIATEYPNLLPLLPEIPRRLWSDPNLFSFHYWVGAGQEQPYINVLAQKQRKISTLSEKSHWRWLKKQSPLVVRGWRQCRKGDLLPLMTHGVTEKIPVCVIVLLVTYLSYFNHYEKYQTTVVRLLIIHTLKIWKTEGIKALRRYLKSKLRNELHDLMDYWDNEGHAIGGIPATWENFLARSHAWHEAILEQQRRIKDEEHRRLIQSCWNTPIQSHTIENITFSSLNTGSALLEEGQRMHHCIFTYVQRCIEKNYLVFSTQYLSGKKDDTHYATLGLRWHNTHKKWVVEQHRGPCNSNIPLKVQKAGQVFCRLINQT
ncbi:hypothetical protein A6043_06470 [[Haemophilus] ducreyi]|uniref:PcfJ domain-containing protein n=1 Tax=Haemophilus ducreyi TaxID=730 RepID=UPI0007CDAB69|nr:PcfJ domain-containing protein [[Haemophilus] ducreyi]ANF70970.1 hypothetical protein A6043_06470 [[Haemophilus] ducreyi]ANF71847.1 hypothetical protein A6044_02640 [[Haemophilus] ducreyi]